MDTETLVAPKELLEEAKKELLLPLQKELRRNILDISFERGFSHLGSCLSDVDLILSVYQHKKPNDKFILSNGHAGVALYAVLEKFGLIKHDQIKNLRVHPDRNPDIGIEVSTGSLGQGLPIGVGMALSNRGNHIYCMVSDGEYYEGSIWESLRFAEDSSLSNLTIIVNANGWGAYHPVTVPNLISRTKSFCSNVALVDGHDLSKIEEALAVERNDKPVVIFGETTVEQLPFLKGQDAHYYVMTEQDYQEGDRKSV